MMQGWLSDQPALICIKGGALMPHTWALVDSSFPTFTENDTPQDQIAALVDYMMILTEALKYQL